MSGCERHPAAFDPQCAVCALEAELRALPTMEPPADVAATVVAAIAGEDAALEARLRSMPHVEPPLDLAAAVLDELAYEDRLQRSAVWRAGGISLSAAAAGMLLLTDPAGLSSAAASFFTRASAYVPRTEHLGPVATLGDFASRTEPGLADHVVSAFDSAQIALAGGMAGPQAAGGWFATGGLWWMVLGIAGLVALNGVVAKALMRRA